MWGGLQGQAHPAASTASTQLLRVSKGLAILRLEERPFSPNPSTSQLLSWLLSQRGVSLPPSFLSELLWLWEGSEDGEGHPLQGY